MGLENIIQRILLSRRDLTREEVLRMIDERKEMAEKFFTEEAVGRIVASELGVKILRKPFLPYVSIQDLVSGLNDVTLIGRVITIYSLKTFARPNGTEGKYSRLVISDKAGETLKVVLWDDKTSVVEEKRIEPGQIVKISHGYVREGWDGKLELQVGERGDVQVYPKEAVKGEYPSVPTTRFVKIKKVKPNMRNVKLYARVIEVGEVREFSRTNGEIGFVSTLLLKDETESIHLNLWEDKAILTEQIQPGDTVLVEGAYTRERFGIINLNVGRRGTLTRNLTSTEAEKLPPNMEEKTKIAEIKKEGGTITVEGSLITQPFVREVVTKQGKSVIFASYDLIDDTGKIGVTIWGRLVEDIRDLPVGTHIKIKNAYVKKDFSNQLILTSHVLTSIKVLPKTEK